ncbi:MAG: DUF3592 domain-containing protein [Leptolyngbyaceae bacterium]|nr:DUF3592 domain-containing protein [Leptolyngbyaceae bacterium]
MPGFARIVFFLLGLAAVIAGIRIFEQNRQTQRWHTTKGTIIDSQVTGIDEDFLTVRYQYTVKGVQYVGDRFNVSGGSVGNAPQLVKRYRQGAIVEVIYDPRNPSKSALVRDSMFIPAFMISIGIVFILVGLLAQF